MSPQRFVWESGRHPFEVLLHVYCVLSGGSYLTGLAPRPQSIVATLPGWVLVGWYWLLLAGGLTGLLAAWMQGRIGLVEHGLQIECAALWFLAGGVFIYSFALFYINGMQAFGAGMFIGAYGVAVLWRLVKAWRLLHSSTAPA